MSSKKLKNRKKKSNKKIKIKTKQKKIIESPQQGSTRIRSRMHREQMSLYWMNRLKIFAIRN